MDLPEGSQRLSKCGVVYKPIKEKDIECYIYADFAGGWDQADYDNLENIISRVGYVIVYVGCPVLWCNK